MLLVKIQKIGKLVENRKSEPVHSNVTVIKKHFLTT